MVFCNRCETDHFRGLQVVLLTPKLLFVCILNFSCFSLVSIKRKNHLSEKVILKSCADMMTIGIFYSIAQSCHILTKLKIVIKSVYQEQSRSRVK